MDELRKKKRKKERLELWKKEIRVKKKEKSKKKKKKNQKQSVFKSPCVSCGGVDHQGKEVKIRKGDIQIWVKWIYRTQMTIVFTFVPCLKKKHNWTWRWPEVNVASIRVRCTCYKQPTPNQCHSSSQSSLTNKKKHNKKKIN